MDTPEHAGAAPPPGPAARLLQLDQFVLLVAEMRAAQRQYFRTRDYSLVEKCKQLERAVDQAIEQMGTPSQPTLF